MNIQNLWPPYDSCTFPLIMRN